MANEAEFQSADLSADEGGRDSPALDTVHTISECPYAPGLFSNFSVEFLS